MNSQELRDLLLQIRDQIKGESSWFTDGNTGVIDCELEVEIKCQTLSHRDGLLLLLNNYEEVFEELIKLKEIIDGQEINKISSNI